MRIIVLVLFAIYITALAGAIHGVEVCPKIHTLSIYGIVALCAFESRTKSVIYHFIFMNISVIGVCRLLYEFTFGLLGIHLYQIAIVCASITSIIYLCHLKKWM